MSHEVLGKHWDELKRKDNVLNVAVGTKFRGGQDTGIEAIVVYVRKKVPPAELTAEHLIPNIIEGVVTDVVELAPTTWRADKTGISELHPDDQRRRLGLKTAPKAMAVRHAFLVGTPTGASDLTKWASAVQDQMNCGACTAFGIIGVWEGCHRILVNNVADPIKLSEEHLFFCSGGTCDGGNTPEAVLDQAENGVCLETCLPYQDVDKTCGTGICANWWENAKKLAEWQPVSDPNSIKVLLDAKPLNGTMQVHNSFFNYVSGVYKNMGAQDPIAGGHDIGVYGYSDQLHAYLIRNSWNTTWGSECIGLTGNKIPGYAWVDYGELDPTMYEMVPSLDPVPDPNPPAPPNPTPNPTPNPGPNPNPNPGPQPKKNIWGTVVAIAAIVIAVAAAVLTLVHH